jgi:hypothetical protein
MLVAVYVLKIGFLLHEKQNKNIFYIRIQIAFQ